MKVYLLLVECEVSDQLAMSEEPGRLCDEFGRLEGARACDVAAAGVLCSLREDKEMIGHCDQDRTINVSDLPHQDPRLP